MPYLQCSPLHGVCGGGGGGGCSFKLVFKLDLTRKSRLNWNKIIIYSGSSFTRHAWNFHILIILYFRVIEGNNYTAIATTQINNSHVNDIPLHIDVGTRGAGEL